MVALGVLAGSLLLPIFTSAAAVSYGRSSFDYIVIGSGPGGATVAARLSEDPNVTVALVEAGTWATIETGNQSQIPYEDYHYNSKTLDDFNPRAGWGFHTTPQAGVNGEEVHYARGKSLGGSSNLNYMAYTYTTKGALKRWSDIVGDQSWNFANVTQYYRKSMNFQYPDTSARIANATVSYLQKDLAFGGPLDVGYASYAQPWSTWLRLGFDQAGIKNTHAFIDGTLNGSSWLLSTVNNTNGHRASSAVSYLAPNVGRKNLQIIPLTLAKQVLFNSAKEATGVRVQSLKDNSTRVLNANREVIVSAGVFQSPQLLQVSGVGPAALLNQFNIPVVADRPGVGQNMSDHVFYGIAYQVNVDTNSMLSNSTKFDQAVKQFDTNGTGPLCSPGGDYVGYEKVPQDLRANWSQSVKNELAQYPKDWPELELFTLPNYVGDFFKNATPPMDGKQYATLLSTIVVPTSRGNISISSNDTQDAPLINPNWLTSQSDKDVVIAGFKRMRQILTQPVMSNVTVGSEFYPGASVQTDEEIFAQIQKSFNTMYHAATSCRMGRADDISAVVDSRARVIGVKRLRVVDASAFALLPPGLPQASIYMFAEKIADDIRNGR